VKSVAQVRWKKKLQVRECRQAFIRSQASPTSHRLREGMVQIFRSRSAAGMETNKLSRSCSKSKYMTSTTMYGDDGVASVR
jgi:hypothetical protein